MSYNYSQLNNIIALQYAKKDNIDDDNDYNWFLEETLKMGKGYIHPSNYFLNVGNKIIENRYNKEKKNKVIDAALYIDI
jgi:hypothetical protein